MSTLTRWYPGDQGLELLLVAILGVTLVSTAAWLVARRLAGKAALRHLVLFSALVSCLALPPLAWVCAATGLALVSIPMYREEKGRAASEVPKIESVPVRTQPRPLPESPPIAPKSALPSANMDTTTEPSRIVATAPALNEMPALPSPVEPVDQQSGSSESTLVTFREIAAGTFLVWVAGALLMLVRLARNCGRVVLLRRCSHPSQNEDHLSLLKEIAAKLGMRQAPRLLVSSRTVIPLAVGFGRPAVILPECLLAVVSADELRDVLVHETAHLRRGDQRIVLLQELAGALYWPIVTVHALNRELQRTREELCDNFVLEGRDALGYGETLLHIAELLVSARPMKAAVGVVGCRGELERRVAGLIDSRRSRRTSAGLKTTCLVMSLFIALGAVLSTTRLAVSAAADGGQTPVEPKASATAQSDKKSPEPEADRTVILKGKVLSRDARPVAGARLYLAVDEWTYPVELGTSDAKGLYRFEVPEKKLRRTVLPGFRFAECQASLIAVAEGHGAELEELRSVRGDRYGAMRLEYSHDFRLGADSPIAGKIVDTDGKPVTGAVVVVDAVFDLTDGRWHKMPDAIEAGDPDLMTREETDPNGWFTRLYPTAWTAISAATDSEGRFRLAGLGPDRAIRLHVDGPGIRSANVCVITRGDVADFTQAIRTKYPRTRRPNGAGSPEGDQGVLLFGPSLTIEVDPARTIAGVVRDPGTGEPIAGARVQVVGFYGSAMTDRRGRYRILRTEAEPFLLVNVAPSENDRSLSLTRRFDNTKGLGEITADFELPRGVVVQGRVLEADTGRPIISAPYSSCHVEWPGPLRTGSVTYYPLATNAALRGTPAGLNFEGFPANYLWAEIGSDGRFRLAVPPGPGVLLIQSTPGLPSMCFSAKESDGFHKLFPYIKLSARTANDGAPFGVGDTIPGYAGAIPIGDAYHAYRVIDPAADAKGLEVDFAIPRGKTRTVRFVGPDGRPMKGVSVQGLSHLWMSVVLDGSEAEVIGLSPGKSREVTATSGDGKFSARALVSADDPQPKTMKLEAAGSVTGRIVDENGKPLEVVVAPITADTGSFSEARTGADGRFRIGSLWPWHTYAARIFHGNATAEMAFENLTVRSGEDRDLGDIRIKASGGK